MDKKRWVFAASVLDKAGTVTAMSSVFSNRGVSMQMLVGSTLQVAAGQGIPMFFVFEATEPRMNVLLRAMGRLASVTDVECHPYDSPLLRAVAFVHVTRAPADDDGNLPAVATEGEVAFTPIVCEDEHESWVLMGLPADVEDCLQRLRSTERLLRSTVMIIPAG